MHGGPLAPRRAAVADDPEITELAERVDDVVGVHTAFEPLPHVVLADAVLLAEEVQQLRGDAVELEEARRRHVKQQPLAVHVDLVQVRFPELELHHLRSRLSTGPVSGPADSPSAAP